MKSMFNSEAIFDGALLYVAKLIKLYSIAD